jgi:hypothetical protein
LSGQISLPKQMTKFEVREVFRLQSRRQVVIAGITLEGNARAGMHARVWLDSQAYWILKIESVEFIDRFQPQETLVGLLCNEQDPSDAETCGALCPMGTIIELTESDA